MLTAILLAIAAALAVTLAGVLLKRPRTWVIRFAGRVRNALSLRGHDETQAAIDRLTADLAELTRRHEEAQLAIERIAVELASRRYSQDGNPDDELYDDWYRWFKGDPEADGGNRTGSAPYLIHS